MCGTQRRLLRGRVFVIMAMAMHKLHPLSSHRRIGWKLMHTYSRRKGRIATTLLVSGSSDAISPSSALRFRCFRTLRHSCLVCDPRCNQNYVIYVISLKSRGILTARFEDHFLVRNKRTSIAYKIGSFHSKHLKLCNRDF